MDRKNNLVNVRHTNLKGIGYEDLEQWVSCPDNIYIGRSNKHAKGATHSKWNNPFTMKSCGDDRDLCVQKFKDYILLNSDLMSSLHELKGKNLGCWCYPQKCHGDILIALVNEHCYTESNTTPTSKISPIFVDDDFPKLG